MIDLRVIDLKTGGILENSWLCDHGNGYKDGFYTSELHVDGKSYYSHILIPPPEAQFVARKRLQEDDANFKNLGFKIELIQSINRE